MVDAAIPTTTLLWGFSWAFTCDSGETRDRSCGVFGVPQAVSVPIAASAFPSHSIMGIAGRGRRVLRFPDGHVALSGSPQRQARSWGGKKGVLTANAASGRPPTKPTRRSRRRTTLAPAVVPSGMAACIDPARAGRDRPLLPGHVQRLKPKKRIFAFTEAELCGPPAIRGGPVVRSGRVRRHDVRAGHGSGTQGPAVGGAAVLRYSAEPACGGAVRRMSSLRAVIDSSCRSRSASARRSSASARRSSASARRRSTSARCLLPRFMAMPQRQIPTAAMARTMAETAEAKAVTPAT